ncbi:MAG: hypothetical protein IKO68_07435 [Oscillospiraceae bacterium]|nr:hypothetical protein [Oscillospiraceae bacterium]
MRDPKTEYGDIIYREHPVSSTHPPMSRSSRAAQFAPFAALTGYDELIEESARETLEHKPPEDEKREELCRRLEFLLQQSPVPEAGFTWFVHDRRKSGGQYTTRVARLLRFQAEEESITLEDGTAIPLRDLKEIEGTPFNDWL